MIVQVIHIDCVFAIEAEGHTPVGRNGNRKVATLASFERVQPKTGKVQTFRTAAPVQRCQNAQEFRNVARWQPC